MELIQEIGSYAGFAAVVGLAVLSALYFSQARDVRRLRDWAGRAPERAAEAEDAVARVVSAEPVAARETPATRAKPAAVPAGGAAAGGAAAGAGAAGAAAGAGAAKPAAAGAGAGATTVKPAAAGAGVGAGVKPGQDAKAPGAPVPAGGTPGEDSDKADSDADRKPAVATPAEGDGADDDRAAAPAVATPAGAAASGAGSALPAMASAAGAAPATTSDRETDGEGARPDTQTGVKVLPAQRATPPVRRPPTLPRTGAQTSVLGQRPPGSRPPARRESRWPAPRYIALIVAGVIILGLGGVVGVMQLAEEEDKSDEPSSQPQQTDVGDEPADSPDRPEPARIDPSKVTVAVLNATNTTGLALRIGSRLESEGFVLGNISNASDRQRPESVAMFKDGANDEARAVARRLDITQIEPIDGPTQALAGNATVVVVLGADKAQQ